MKLGYEGDEGSGCDAGEGGRRRAWPASFATTLTKTSY